VHGVAADRRVERTRRLHLPVSEGQVLAVHVPRRDGTRQGRDRLQRAAHHHQPARVLVQAVHDARARQRSGVGPRVQQAVEQRPGPVAGSRVHHEPGALVHHEQRLVLVHDVEGHRLGPEGEGLGRRHEFHRDHVAGAHLARRRADDRGRDLHVAVFDQVLEVAARELGHACGQHLVEPAGVQPGRHRQPAHLDIGGGLRLGRGCPRPPPLPMPAGRPGRPYNLPGSSPWSGLAPRLLHMTSIRACASFS
jgi:hypothetical protein